MAFGNPLGLENSVSMGVVSSVARQIKPDDTMIYIQTDAPINPGNSGGPLVDADGSVMGINTFILSQSGGSEGLGFAIPSNIMRNVYHADPQGRARASRRDRRLRPDHHARSWPPACDSRRIGACCWRTYTRRSGRQRRACRRATSCLSLNGKSMENARQLEVQPVPLPGGRESQPASAARWREADLCRWRWWSGTTIRSASPTWSTRRKTWSTRLGILGIDIDQKVAAMLPDLRKQYGVVVAARGGDSPYSGDSLQLGDVIYAVNGAPVTSIAALRKALDGLKETDPLVLQVERDGRLIFLTLEIE